MVAKEWTFIEDLPKNSVELHDSGLESLAAIWKEQSATLVKRDALAQFNERLRREWAIETGIIENLYSIDRGTTQLLIERGIEASLIPYGTTDKPAELIVPIIQAQQEALEGLFAFVKGERELSTSYIKELHQVITRNQETVAAKTSSGKLIEVQLLRDGWQKWPNNLTRINGQIHEYSQRDEVPF